MKIRTVIIALWGIVFSLQKISAQAEKTIQEMTDSLVEVRIAQYQIPGLALGIVRNGEIIYAKGYGVKNADTGAPVDENTIFHAASVSKLFTALAVVELAIENKLSLDDKVTDIVKGLNYKDERLDQVTLRQLLNHTSGMPDIYNYNWPSYKEDASSLRTYFKEKRLKLRTNPGTSYRYSNLGYDLLGLVVEAASGESFEDYVKRKLLLPAEATASDFRHFLTPEADRSSPHTLSGKKVKVRDTYPYNREHAPSSTLNTSAREMGQWMIHFMKLLKESPNKPHYEAMLEPSTNVNGYIGLGFQIGSINEFKKVGHYGSDQGYRSYLFMLTEKELGLVLLANCDYNEDFRQEILHPIAAWLASGN